MEILIIGGAIVALMVYVSTRIKRSAAAAYDREIIETEEFSIRKPEGFMHPLRENSEFAFEAFSEVYGDGELRNFWQSNAELLVHSDKKFKDVCAEAKKNADEILSEKILTNAPADQRICLIEGEQTSDEVKKRIFWKIVESLSRKKVYEFRVFVLDNHLSDQSSKTEEILEGFTVK